MTLYMPPLQRKKRVPNRYNPDSFRVISDDAESYHPKFSGISDYRPPSPERQRSGVSLPNIYSRTTQVLPKTVPDYRVNKPHPGSCGFLRHNVRVLNEPICSVYTAVTQDEQNLWWPSRTSDDPLQVPEQTKDTIYRNDYMKEHTGNLHRTTRHESNTNRDPALGPDVMRKLASYELREVPVNFLKKRDNKQRVFVEKKSYEHDYNSRIDPNYPIRAKRVGSFVWDEMSPELTKQFVEQHSNLLDAKQKFEESSATIENKSPSEMEPSQHKQTTPPATNITIPPPSQTQPPAQEEKSAEQNVPKTVTFQDKQSED